VVGGKCDSIISEIRKEEAQIFTCKYVTLVNHENVQDCNVLKKVRKEPHVKSGLQGSPEGRRCPGRSILRDK